MLLEEDQHVGQTPARCVDAGLFTSVITTSVLNGPQASAIVGGTAKGGSYAFTAKLDIGKGKRSCSAALVASEWLVTVASCFADNPTQSYMITPGAPMLSNTASSAALTSPEQRQRHASRRPGAARRP
ncbi:trypsin-like serine protease [Streptomyces sp. VNUA116]|uniref:trypsin-like serine protease n=1 Tax=Streptomyces sp. VNUA116 TaxID=3062449 RepID=UPI0026747351|nr:trypsin-like serine protease [Streptomyces sp. VNUA116]WKU47546.1 trypsin-like serine protease [Streptomyces sp. VNUA116]